ncbi:hypothetical protein AAFC00_000916 [Neodothiora populina]|uniref:Gamma-glutamyltranspeptidase n=1 Tax=Neodothiora populina TaxID=2781224 RepID=A0ABR3PN88_9PEZI
MPLNYKGIYPSSDPEFVAFPSRRSVVHSTKGIVSSTQPLATNCGIRVLQQGGNCADAAVAVAAGLNITEPGSTGIGGDMFCLFYDAKTKKVHAMNGSGRAPAKASCEDLRKALGIEDGQKGQIPMLSSYAVTVPGAAAGWCDVVAKFGSGKLGMEEILAPAIELGENGFPVSELMGTYWRRGEQMIRDASPNFAEMLKRDPAAQDGCRAPEPGEIMKNPTLAQTFREVGKHGKAGFYTGRVAEELVKVLQDKGTFMTLDDLKSHMDKGTEEVDPIKLNFRGQGIAETHGSTMHDKSSEGVDVWEHPPNGQGIVALMALGMMQILEEQGKIPKFQQKEHNSAAHIHAVVETLRIAFADANWWVADPNVSKVPSQGLISREYLTERAKLYNPLKAGDIPDRGSPAHSHSDTVYFAATDSEGNGISFINSNYAGFGTAIIPKGCGFTLQNRGCNFQLGPDDHPNVYAPSKRPYHTIIPALITNASDQSLHSVYGVMGGFMQPQGHVQVLLNMLVFGYTPQAALDAPRICIGAGMPDSGDVFDKTVYLEEGISQATHDELKAMGHNVEFVKSYARGLFGRGQVIRWHLDEQENQGVWSAGSDPRGDGAAVPYM